MRKIIGNYLILAAALLLLSQASCTNKMPEKPNIIFIIADDQSYNTLHAHGNNEVQTPTLDRLAEQGTSFTHAYNMGSWSGAVCVASRAMLNTGKFVWRAEQARNNIDKLAESGRLWSQVMKQAGYDTYFSGKWHVNIDPEEIFDQVRHVRPGMPKTVPEAYNRPVEGQEDKWSPFDTSLGGYWNGGKHWSEVLGDDAVDFIQQASEKENPFFMYLAFNAPHDPRQSPKEYVDMYSLENISVPESFLPKYPYQDEIGCGEELRDARLAPFPRTEYVEFKSMLPYLRSGQEENSYDAIYGCYKDLQRMIRDDQFKLIACPYAGRVRLYDLGNDPLEMNDLADVHPMQPLVFELFTKLEKLGKDMGDILDIRSFFPEFQ